MKKTKRITVVYIYDNKTKKIALDPASLPSFIAILKSQYRSYKLINK